MALLRQSRPVPSVVALVANGGGMMSVTSGYAEVSDSDDGNRMATEPASPQGAR